MEFEISDQMTMKEYREAHRKHEEEFLREIKRNGGTAKNMKIVDVIYGPQSVNMMKIRGRDKATARAVETLYANNGRFLRPDYRYPPSMIRSWGKDYALNAQGIYYHNDYSPDLVTCDRTVWTPSLTGIDWEQPDEVPRRLRARVLVEHNINNEAWNKSEYAWEADAWSDVFGDMRNDPCLTMDKHEYSMLLSSTDPITSTMFGDPALVKRIPDATLGLRTFSNYDFNCPVFADELRQERLEKLLLHPQCGLLSDPQWGEFDLVFPFAVYEAKGWNGDCRDARRQACTAGAAYLDLLDNLVRRPGPVGSTKPYQTSTSHRYQVFSLTSFGAHWHLLLGYRRPRLADEYAGTKGMSETVYVFQRIWSGLVTNEKTAWELLSLVEQIHLWAITEFRTFIIDHLRPWHKFCEQNYLLDWDSVYDSGRQQKRIRTLTDTGDIRLPSWTNHLSESSREDVMRRATESLVKAMKSSLKARKSSLKAKREQRRLQKGKSTSQNEDYLVCGFDECCRHLETKFSSDEARLDHLRSDHEYPEREVVRAKLCLAGPPTKVVELGEMQEETDLRHGQREGLSSTVTASVTDDTPGPSKRRRLY